LGDDWRHNAGGRIQINERNERVLTGADFHLVDVIVGQDFPTLLLGVVDTTVEEVVDTADVSERVTRPRSGGISIALKLFPL
jgi:hypothetical protein